MNKTLEYTVCMFIEYTVCMFIGAAIGIGITTWVSCSVWEYQAIKHNAGEYNGQTGKFQWKQLND